MEKNNPSEFVNSMEQKFDFTGVDATKHNPIQFQMVKLLRYMSFLKLRDEDGCCCCCYRFSLFKCGFYGTYPTNNDIYVYFNGVKVYDGKNVPHIPEHLHWFIPYLKYFHDHIFWLKHRYQLMLKKEICNRNLDDNKTIEIDTLHTGIRYLNGDNNGQI